MELKPASDSDLELILAWRNNPDVYSGFYTQSLTNHLITWEEHLAWWKSRNSDWHEFLIWYEGRRIGVVTIVQCDNWTPEVGFFIGETSLWNKGIGAQAVKLAEEWLRDRGYVQTHTTVPVSNTRAIYLLKERGWIEAGHARKGELRFEKEL